MGERSCDSSSGLVDERERVWWRWCRDEVEVVVMACTVDSTTAWVVEASETRAGGGGCRGRGSDDDGGVESRLPCECEMELPLRGAVLLVPLPPLLGPLLGPPLLTPPNGCCPLSPMDLVRVRALMTLVPAVEDDGDRGGGGASLEVLWPMTKLPCCGGLQKTTTKGRTLESICQLYRHALINADTVRVCSRPACAIELAAGHGDLERPAPAPLHDQHLLCCSSIKTSDRR